MRRKLKKKQLQLQSKEGLKMLFVWSVIITTVAIVVGIVIVGYIIGFATRKNDNETFSEELLKEVEENDL